MVIKQSLPCENTVRPSGTVVAAPPIPRGLGGPQTMQITQTTQTTETTEEQEARNGLPLLPVLASAVLALEALQALTLEQARTIIRQGLDRRAMHCLVAHCLRDRGPGGTVRSGGD